MLRGGWELAEGEGMLGLQKGGGGPSDLLARGSDQKAALGWEKGHGLGGWVDGGTGEDP